MSRMSRGPRLSDDPRYAAFTARQDVWDAVTYWEDGAPIAPPHSGEGASIVYPVPPLSEFGWQVATVG